MRTLSILQTMLFSLSICSRFEFLCLVLQSSSLKHLLVNANAILLESLTFSINIRFRCDNTISLPPLHLLAWQVHRKICQIHMSRQFFRAFSMPYTFAFISNSSSKLPTIPQAKPATHRISHSTGLHNRNFGNANLIEFICMFCKMHL